MAKRVINPNLDSGFTGRGHSLLMPYGQLYLVAVFVMIFLLAGSVRTVAAAYHVGFFPDAFAPPAQASHAETPAIDEKALGPDHPRVVVPAGNLASRLRKLGRDSEARVYEEQAARIRAKMKRRSTRGGQNP